MSDLAKIGSHSLPRKKQNNNQTVVLLHGMGRSRASLGVLQICLKWAGFRVLNFPYSPLLKTLDEITLSLMDYLQEYVQTPTYHLVAHSLGNVIIRNGFRRQYKPDLGRIVMLAPPNRPAHLAQSLKDNLFYKLLHGDSGQKLASSDFFEHLPIPPVEFGIIAGTRGQSITFQAPNDGIVSIETTRLEGMKDWISLHHTHTFMMNCRDTIDQVISFLQTGEFSRV